MNKKIVLSAFASLFLLSAVIGSQLIVSVAAQSVGVSVDDWAEYDVTYSGNATMPPPNQKEEWGKITVLGISGTNITYQQITRYADNHNETETYWLDVATGQANFTYAPGIFIAANLDPDDLIYTSPPPESGFVGATITETISRTYPVIGTVEVNHLNRTFSWSELGRMITQTMNFYWHRTTGMAVEVSIYTLEQPDVGPSTWMKIEYKTIDIIPEFPPALILPLFMIATLAAVWLGKTIWSTKKLIKKTSPCA